MQLLTIFSQSMEMKIELMQQGGLEFLIKQSSDLIKQSSLLIKQTPHTFEENDTLQKDFGDAVTQLFGMDDGLVTQLPLDTVLLLGGSAVTAAKSQAAKACVQKAEELAAKEEQDQKRRSSTTAKDTFASRQKSMELEQDIRKMTGCLNGMIDDVLTDIAKGTGQHRQFAKQIILSCIESIEIICRIPKTEFKKILANEVSSKGLIDVLTCTESAVAAPSTKQRVADIIHKLCGEEEARKILEVSSALSAGLLKCLLSSSNEGVQPCTRDVIASVELLVASEGKLWIAQSDGVHIIFKLLKKVCTIYMLYIYIYMRL
jgi:hypothetical protein